jgi:Icc-related predicted phosphoesterase
MKFVCISDTHNMLDRIDVPDGDVLIHTGDATFQGSGPELIKFNRDMRRLPHKYKVFVPGNHDHMFEVEDLQALAFMDPSITVLNGNGIEIEGIKIWGSPIQPVFFDWAFNRHDHFRKEYWSKIPDNTDILLTHCPPFGKLDMVHREGTLEIENTGCPYLADHVQNRVKPKYHVFGHIHENYGFQKEEHTTFINASSCDGRYKPVNKPIIFHL